MIELETSDPSLTITGYIIRRPAGEPSVVDASVRRSEARFSVVVSEALWDAPDVQTVHSALRTHAATQPTAKARALNAVLDRISPP